MAGALLCIHTAAWVLPVSRPPIADGGVAVADGRIAAVDKARLLRRRFPTAPIHEHLGCALTPALVNAHTHLELSHLAGLTDEPWPGSFTGWISRLLEWRGRLGAIGEAAEDAAERALAGQYASGVSLIADIGNTTMGQSLAKTFAGTLMPFREYLGLAAFTLGQNSHRLAEETDETRCTGHAPYSTHPRLLQQLKARATKLGHPFPLHTAEPAAEGEMLGSGTGEMVEFVRDRGFWDDSFRPSASGDDGSIRYLDALGLLDEQTLCVHAIHVDANEIRLMADRGTKVCVCPGSNRFLRTGRAPVQAFLQAGILPALGTDSLASNPHLSLWREMQLLSEDHPDIDPATIFAMATRGGAEALGLGDRFGTLEPGRQADLLAVPVPRTAATAAAVHAHLVTGGSALAPARIL
ncbi:MAG: amidohydrolase family protein [Desulfobulbus sp.]|jgi:cytosine/adenosine deaminase-related metal-dependent hydrolase|nr:amidohydrolase family protein [Desulfobulbus sp.]